MIQMKVSEFMFKYHNHLLPDSFQNMFQPLALNNRTAGYRIDIIKYEYLQYFPSISFPRIWNRMHIDYKKAEKFSNVKKALEQTYILKYSSFKCNKKNCYSCIHFLKS